MDKWLSLGLFGIVFLYVAYQFGKNAGKAVNTILEVLKQITSANKEKSQ